MIQMDSNVAEWMRSLAGQNFAALRLKYAGNEAAMQAILQLECRKKCASKIPEFLKNNNFCFPTSLSAEQCTSETLAKFHRQLVTPGGKILDMTCGLGIDALYLASVSSELLAIDIDSNIAETANYNARSLGIDNFKAICADSSAFIKSLDDNSFSTIFIDPARRSQGRKVVLLEDCSPDVSSLISQMLRIATVVVIKASPMLDATAAIKALSCVKDVYAIGTPTECKELTIVCQRGYSGTPKLHAVTLTKHDSVQFTYPDTDASSLPSYSTDIRIGQYLYEPYPAVMKAGRFNTLAENFNVKMLSHDTHIFISDNLSAMFPGRKMRILFTAPYNKRTAKQIKSQYPKANVTTRGFVIPAPQLAKTLGIDEGGELMIYGLGLHGNRNYHIAVCQPI